MRRGYIRITSAGPTLEQQQDALRSVGIEDFSPEGPVYVDRPAKRKQKPDDVLLPWRAEAVKRCRPGDELVVASASRLASSTPDALAVLEQLGARQAKLLIVDTGRTYLWHPDVRDGLALANEIASSIRAEIMAKARAKARERKPLAKLSGMAKKVAAAKWRDPNISTEAIAEEAGVSERTLYRELGPRGTPAYGKGATL